MKKTFLVLLLSSFYLLNAEAQVNTRQLVRFGICSDIHKDIMYDSDARLTEFIKEASKRDLDFIIELGDFCRPYDYNLEFLNI